MMIMKYYKIAEALEDNGKRKKGSKKKFIFKVPSDPRLNEVEEGPDFDKLNRDAVKSLHILPDVVKTDEGFEVV